MKCRRLVLVVFYLSLISCSTSENDNPSEEVHILSDEELMTEIQKQTFKYFWDGAHESSGMALERSNGSNNVVTSGGSGFGVMAIIVGIERNFITSDEGANRILKITEFLLAADRFHGAFPHWYNGNTGKVIPFSQMDNGGDIVETSFLIQGLLTALQYFTNNTSVEEQLRLNITKLWEEVEWSWYVQPDTNYLTWHWSPEYEFEQNHRISGYNEALVTYVLAASSTTYPINANVYHEGWAHNGQIKNGKTFYEHELPLGYDFGGPLFFAHYSFLGLNPTGLVDQYANYWEQNVAHTKINYAYCVENPKGYKGYSSNIWGITASDNHLGYSAHSPTNDLGVISPTAAVSSIPYLPASSLKFMRALYETRPELWGKYGFYDAFNDTENWVADSYLAIDQGPMVIMIENYRTQLLWGLFMQNEDVKRGLLELGFSSPYL